MDREGGTAQSPIQALPHPGCPIQNRHKKQGAELNQRKLTLQHGRRTSLSHSFLILPANYSSANLRATFLPVKKLLRLARFPRVNAWQSQLMDNIRSLMGRMFLAGRAFFKAHPEFVRMAPALQDMKASPWTRLPVGPEAAAAPSGLGARRQAEGIQSIWESSPHFSQKLKKLSTRIAFQHNNPNFSGSRNHASWGPDPWRVKCCSGTGARLCHTAER
jgi:hypothetical protein